jgi:ADP-ribosyl-[dinitrogen reductase] hydrolase
MYRAQRQGVPPGTRSDDGAHALCLLASLLESRDLDLDDLGRRLLNWYLKGYMAVDAKVFDIGNQTVRALALQSGVPASEAGEAEEHSNGNGSLMRVLPWPSGTKGAMSDS